MKPTKENTLHLPVEQVHIDAILDGTKKQELREMARQPKAKNRNNLYIKVRLVYFKETN